MKGVVAMPHARVYTVAPGSWAGPEGNLQWLVIQAGETEPQVMPGTILTIGACF